MVANRTVYIIFRGKLRIRDRFEDAGPDVL